MSATPTDTGRAMADRDVLEAVHGLLAEMAVSQRAQAAVSATMSQDDAAFVAARRKRLEQIRDGLGRAQG